MTDLSKNALVMMEGVSKKDTVFTSASHSEHVRPMLMVGDQSRIRNSMLWVHLYKEIGLQNKTDFLDIINYKFDARLLQLHCNAAKYEPLLFTVDVDALPCGIQYYTTGLQ